MEINSLALVYFSPTGTTKKVLSGIADGVGAKITKLINLAIDADIVEYNAVKYDLVIVGVPTYASRIPPEATAKIKKLCGNGMPVVLVAVYGNNRFGDALLELNNVTSDCGFVPIATAGFIGEHSFSNTDRPIAADRPDQEDLSKAKGFGAMIKKKLLNSNILAMNKALNIPGDFPYREWKKLTIQPPVTDEALCTLCGQCVTVCPVNSITVTDQHVTDSTSCIFCCACVKVCSSSARIMTDKLIFDIRDRLHNNCSERKEPEFFI